MTATQQFIEDAIKGGYGDAFKVMVQIDIEPNSSYLERLLLNPLAWQAVGKTRGWRNVEEGTFEAEFTCWQAYFESFFRSIREGKTIEEALSALS